MERLGHPAIGRGVYQWLNKVRQRHRPFLYWFQKYSIDGVPEWETPAVDQTALIPWGLERHYRRTGDLDLVASVWPMIEQAAAVCCGESGGHPGLRLLEDLNLISSAGSGDQLFGAFLYSNACVVAGLRAAARLATQLGMTRSADALDRVRRSDLERRYPQGDRHQPARKPGLVDPDSGRFLQARRLSKLRGLWTDDPEFLVDHRARPRHQHAGPLRPVRPLAGLRSAVGPDRREHPARQRRAQGRSERPGPRHLRADAAERNGSTSDQHDVSSLATLWMVRFLIQLGRETGQARHWSRALAMLEGILGRLSQLGLVAPVARPRDGCRRSLIATRAEPPGDCTRCSSTPSSTSPASTTTRSNSGSACGPRLLGHGRRPGSSSRSPAATFRRIWSARSGRDVSLEL